jgi:hypothetical protein
MMKSAALIVFVCCTASAFAAAPPAEFIGGSDYTSYRLDGCRREPYGVVSNYGAAHDVIDRQLRTMHAGGQRRLRIPVFFSHGIDNGTIVDSSRGVMATTVRDNLAGLLASMKAIGFQEVEVGFFPIHVNSPQRWTEWHEALYRENFAVIADLRPIIAGAGMAYRIDLLNEGIPDPSQPVLLQYVQRLWSDYTAAYGAGDTVGFSVIPSPRRIAQIPAVYHGLMPKAFDLHPYDNAASVLATAHAALTGMGFGDIPWIIGETFYDDATEAQDIAQAAAQTGHRILFLMQWPLSRSRNCKDVDVIPLDFTQYRSLGF